MSDREKPLWEKVLEALGFNTTRLRWKLMQRRERARRDENRRENKRRVLTYKHKTCGQCGELVAGDERRCPHCDARLAGPVASRVKRVLRLLVPKGTYTYTSALVALNVAFYLAMVMRAYGGPSLDAFRRGITLPVLFRFGGIVPEALAHGQVWRLVTPIFLHGGLLHVLFNSLWLVSLGPLIEHHYGRQRYLFLYVASGAAGFLLSALGHWGSPIISVGSSGSVFGLMAAAVVAGYVRRIAGGDDLRGGNLIKWIVLACVLSFLPHVDYFAHLGGAVLGAALTFFFAPRTQVRRLPDGLWVGVELLTVASVIASFAAAWLAGPTP